MLTISFKLTKAQETLPLPRGGTTMALAPYLER